MASKATNNNNNNNAIPENEDERKGLIERIAEKIKSDNEIREEYEKGDDERERNIYHSRAIKRAVTALDKEEGEYYKRELGWSRAPQYTFHAVLRTGLYDNKPRIPVKPSAELIKSVYTKLHEKKMAAQLVRQRVTDDPSTVAGLQGKVSSFLGGKRTRKRRHKSRRRRKYKRTRKHRRRRNKKHKRKRTRRRRR